MDVRVTNTVNKIAKQHLLTYADIMQETRKAHIVKARNEVYVVLRDSYLMTFELIGYWFKKNHATILHGYNKAKDSGFSVKPGDSHYRVAINELSEKRRQLLNELEYLDKAIEFVSKNLNP